MALMQFGTSKALEALAARLGSYQPLPEKEQRALHALPAVVRDIPERTDVFREGDRPSDCCFVLQGALCHYKLLPSGRRQITSLLLPGDFADITSFHLAKAPYGLASIPRSQLASISKGALADLMDKSPVVAAALWRETELCASLYREWVVNVGSRSAYQRLAHLICELAVRSGATVSTANLHVDLRLTQPELAEALGLSTVHLNRSMQVLRGEGLIVSTGRKVSIPDWAALCDAAGFDPAYLGSPAPSWPDRTYRSGGGIPT